MRMLFQNRRDWLTIAAVAIGIALLCLLALHAQSGDGGGWLAILPLLFAGVISPLCFFASPASVYSSRAPQAPLLPASFQRPPPSQIH